MNTSFLSGWPVEVDVSFRLALAFLLAGLIGWDREMSGQPAGLRTHMLVAMGSAGFTLLFIYGFPASGAVDPGRAASQIITGIGFLGAGAIWQGRHNKHGLTTAAGIWVVASIGMLAAVGMWYLATLLTLMSFFTLRVLKPVKQIPRRRAAPGAQKGSRHNSPDDATPDKEEDEEDDDNDQRN